MADPLAPGTRSTAGVNTFSPQNLRELQARAYGRGTAPPIDYGSVPGQETMVYLGKAYEKNGKSGMVPLSVAANEYWAFSPEEQAKWGDYNMRVNKYIPGDASAAGLYENFLAGLAQYQTTSGQKIDPFTFMQKRAELFEKTQQVKSGGGGGGGGGPRAVVNLTNPQDAEVLLNNALGTYLGRQATTEEVDSFLGTLNRIERKNPIITSRSGQRGGVNQQLIAEEFAQAQPEAAETQAATTYMDWMFDALTADTSGGITSGL